jgi:MioC protein
MKIAILYGTETGNAEMLAEDVAAHLAGAHEADVTNMADFDPADFDPAIFYIMVTSTYGDGELPASAQPFAAAMGAVRPDLSGVYFAVFGMGDSEYQDTFNAGGRRIEELMRAQGAMLVGERITHDASGPDMADDLALPWAEGVVAAAQRAVAKAA